MPRLTKPIPAALPDPEEIDVPRLAKSCLDGGTDLVCVLGPTASGKTKYAVALAGGLKTLTGREVEIISADSRQIYTGMDIGTGKDLSEYGEVPYHLIDILPAGSKYNVYEFQQDFRRTWNDIRSRGALPILCGGTGLYIHAVTSAYDFRSHTPLSGGKSPAEYSSDPRSATPEGVCALRAGRSCDLLTFPPHPAEYSSDPRSATPEGVCVGDLPQRTFFIGTLVSRELRNERIDRRLDARLQEGMVDEIRGLLDSGVPAETLISYGLEYKFVTQYVLGRLEYDEMRRLLATAIHQFAKRQMTWFRGMERSGVRIHWVQV